MLNKKCALIKQQFVTLTIGSAPLPQAAWIQPSATVPEIFSSGGERLEKLTATRS